jgi:Uma2 family endonuclease
MTAMTFTSAAPITAAEYLALPEDNGIRLELQEGCIVVTPRPTIQHQLSLGRLYTEMYRHETEDFVPVCSVDVDLQLVPPDKPGTVRAPDLVVLTREGFDRIRDGTETIRASDLVLIGEILSPGSHRTDTVIKRAEYAAAGIDHYWIIDLDGGRSLTAHRLAGGTEYVAAESVTGVVEAATPFPVRVDLAELLRRSVPRPRTTTEVSDRPVPDSSP